MTFSTSRLAFDDCFRLFDQALASAKGIKFRVKNRRQAYHYRNRLNHARRLDRRDNLETFIDPTHPMHGRSIYDGLSVVIQFDGGWWLMVEKVESREFNIEPITGDENDTEEPELHNGGAGQAPREEEAGGRPPAPPPTVGLRRL